MDSERILRYSIPGSLFVLASAAFFLCLELAAHVPPGAALDPLKSVSPAIAVALTIPVGFFAYQLYYRGYGPVVGLLCRVPGVTSRLGGVPVTVDGGAVVLRLLPRSEIERVLYGFGAEGEEAIAAVTEPEDHFGLREVPVSQLFKKRSPRSDEVESVHFQAPSSGIVPPLLVLTASGRLNEYKKAWKRNKVIERALRDLAGLAHNPGVKAQYSSVVQVSNTLGASRAAVLTSAPLATLAAFVDLSSSRLSALDPAVEVSWISFFTLGIGFVAAVTVVVYWVLYFARQHSFYAALEGLGWGLRSFLLAHPESIDNLVVARHEEERRRGAAQ